MVNLLRSEWLVELNRTSVDVGLEEQTTLNNWLCLGCWRFYPETCIDLVTGNCLNCVHVDDEGEESEDELDDKIHLMD